MAGVPSGRKRLLIVDDERNARQGLAQALGRDYAAVTAAGGLEAIRLLGEARPPFDLVLTDLRMAGKSGLDVVEFCQTLASPPPCILMTAYGDIETAVRAMKKGAADFLPKPLDLDAVELALKEAVAAVPGWGEDGPPLLGNSEAMVRLLQTVARVAPTDATVLLLGETGVGKELFAREIHRRSGRKGKPFLPVNGAALPRDMVESALFGHERGAFTDAHQRRCGYFERARGGTLLLDEVGELPLEIQVKLLRVLESRTLERLGGSEAIPIDVRLIAATNADLEERMRRGQFREDLFHRLNVVTIPIPPLRERREDIPPLIQHFCGASANPPHISHETMCLLPTYPWPGNVRELRNFCHSLCVLHGGEKISPEHLDGRFFQANQRPIPPLPSRTPLPALEQALHSTGGNHTRAAKILGISRSTLYRRLGKGR
jgi:DNA-binding NtrC family response regulator